VPSLKTSSDSRSFVAEGQLTLFTMSSVMSRGPDKWRHRVSEFLGNGERSNAAELL
jgi:hypothetical protein